MKFRKSASKLLSFVAAFTFAFLTVVNPVKAAENKPQSLHELFNAEFYAAKYPDVVDSIGNTPDALYNHFVEYGINEGRTCSSALNVKMYRDNYPDISAAFGDDWDRVVKHYFEQGVNENRKSFVSQADLDIQNAIDDGYRALNNSKNNSASVLTNSKSDSIVDRIESTLKAASTSDNGYAVDAATGIIADSEGHALIPWPAIQEEGRIQDIDELIARCGNDLILVRDENNQIKFVGGRFSNVKVTDETSAIKALDTMADLYGNIDERSYLKLSETGADSMGNPFYRFVPVDKEVGYTQDKYTVTLSTDKDGNVLGASNTLKSELYSSGDFSGIAEGWGDNLQSVLDDPTNGYTKLYDQAKLVYDPESKNYYWAMYYEKNGIVNEYLVDAIDGDTICMTKYYDAETFYNNPEQSFNRDYEFKYLNNPKEMTFIDYFNNPVKIPVAYEEGKGWYIVDPERHIVGVESPGLKEDSISKSQLYEKHYFSDEYFEAVNAFLSGGKSSDVLENEKILIQSFTTIQSSFDEYKKMGMLPNAKTIYINYKPDDNSDNASQATLADMIIFTINNNAGNADFGGISHEFGHAVVANQGQAIPYQAAIGAINESYADILGNLMKMIKKQEGTYAGNVDFQRWLIGEFLGNDTEHVIRDLSNPANNGVGGTGKNPAPTQVNDQYFVQDEGTYDKENDLGGVHANNSILSHISYRMYNEVIADKDEDGVGKPDMDKYRDLLKIWYDSVIYVNRDSTYSDIKGYVLQAMKNHGYSSEQINQTESIFDDAKVDEYKPFNRGKVVTEVYDQNDMAAAAKVGSKVSAQNELYNYMDSANDLKKAEYDLGIAIDEYKIAKLSGKSDEELKAYEDEITIARNNVELSKNNSEELYNSFVDSQARLKNMLDDKMDKLEKQGEVLKKVAEAKESNPNLTGAYKALRRGVKNSIEDVNGIKSHLDDVVSEFSDEEDIINAYESVWNVELDGLSQDVSGDALEPDSGNQNVSPNYDDIWDGFFYDFFEELGLDDIGIDFNSLQDIDWSDLLVVDPDSSDSDDDWSYFADIENWFDFSDIDSWFDTSGTESSGNSSNSNSDPSDSDDWTDIFDVDNWDDDDWDAWDDFWDWLLS